MPRPTRRTQIHTRGECLRESALVYDVRVDAVSAGWEGGEVRLERGRVAWQRMEMRERVQARIADQEQGHQMAVVRDQGGPPADSGCALTVGRCRAARRRAA